MDHFFFSFLTMRVFELSSQFKVLIFYLLAEKLNPINAFNLSVLFLNLLFFIIL
jgi:hypothetical protein